MIGIGKNNSPGRLSMARYDLNIGATVHCEGDVCGRLAKVVVDTYTQRITDLIVAGRLPLSTDRVVPIDAVERADNDDVHLSLSTDELKAYPEYRDVEYTEPSSGVQEGAYQRGDVRCYNMTYTYACEMPVVPRVRHEVQAGVDADRVVIGRGMRVLNAHGEVARVDHVLIDPENDEITHLVLRRGLVPRYPILPIEEVDEFGDEVVTVDLSEEQVESLPHYRRRSSQDLVAELRDRYAKSSREFDRVEISAEGGIVQLGGAVPDPKGKRHAEAIARSVPGVIDVENRIDVSTSG
jgi:sporulation protein YlmC with PRC-barrel domain